MNQREIKFKAWNIAKKRWEGVYDLVNGDTSYFGDCVAGNTHKDEFHLMQFTGLRDKNGVEIYEGDIVKIIEINGNGEFEPERIEEVEYNEYDATFQVGTWSLNANKYIDEWGEVIGNVWENKELLNL